MKDEVSAFNGTKLLKYLKKKGIKRLVIVGMQTHMCVEGAVRAAYDLGFECILVHDACATRPLTHGGKTVKAGDVHSSESGVTRAAIAAHLATSPETISRSLRALEEAGAIRFDRHRIIIVDSDLLQSIALL